MALQKVGTGMIANDAVTLAKMVGGVDGQVITYSAAGDPVAIGPGTVGQVLTSAGANLPQTFAAAAAGGAWTVIKSIVPDDVTTVNFVHGTADVVIDSTYQYYVLVGSHVIQTGGGGTSIKLSSDSGSSWYGGTNYSYTSRRYGGSSPSGAFTAGAAMFDITPSIEPSTGLPSNWTAEFWNLSQATSAKSFHSKMICARSSVAETYGSNIWGNLNVNAAMNGIQVVSDGGAGNFLSGRMTLYGIAHA